MKCPVCKDATLAMTQRNDIEIDYCPECRGVWLDRGELDKIIERSAGPAPSAPAPSAPARDEAAPRGSERRPEPRRDDRYEHRPRKRRGSFLEDLFDFG